MKLNYLSVLILLSLAGCNSSSDTTSNLSNNSSDDNSSVIPEISSADGWATVGRAVTGGEGGKEYTVTNRLELVAALYGSDDANTNSAPSNESKIIYIKGTIDLSADDQSHSQTAESFMAQCSEYGYSSYDTFYADYNATYGPHIWNSQDLASNNRPPALTGILEEARICYQKAQAKQITMRVGSNTSIIGLDNTAHIKFGNLVLGKSSDPVSNIIIRNIDFQDAFDFFPAWDPTDSFSISSSEFGVGNCSKTHESDTVNPNGCETRKGGRWNSEYDLISVDYAENVWIDHNTLSDGDRSDDQYPPNFSAPYNAKEQKIQHHDGLIDITNGATRVTASYNVFANHDKTNLLGGSDTPNVSRNYGPGAIDVTFHHNYWKNTGQRLPRVRYGRVHLYNNYYQLNTKSDYFPYYPMGKAIILSTAAKVYAENNSFEINASSDASSKIVDYSSSTSNKNKCLKASFSDAQCSTYFYASGNTLDGNSIDLISILKTKASSSSSNAPLTIIDPNDNGAFWLPSQNYEYQLQPVSEVKNDVINHAGAGYMIME